jgi:hypothetical protein
MRPIFRQLLGIGSTHATPPTPALPEAIETPVTAGNPADYLAQSPPVENDAERIYRLASAPLPQKHTQWSIMQPHQAVQHFDYGNGAGVNFYRVPGHLAPGFEFTGTFSDLNGYRRQG